MILYHSGKTDMKLSDNKITLYHSGVRYGLRGADELLPEADVELNRTMLILRGRARLLTYADVLRDDLDPEGIPTLHRVHDKLCLDSGAFTVAQGGGEVDIEEYAAFVRRWGEHFEFYANLDVIGVQDSHVLSQRNQERLESMGLHPMPIFHLGEPFRVLQEMAGRYDYIGLGGIAMPGLGTTRRLQWLDKCFRVIGDQCRVHGYGVGNVELIKAYPWYSVDSTNWLAAARFGHWPPFDSGVYSLTARVLPWLEYLDAVAEMCGAEYVEQPEQHTLFGNKNGLARSRKEDPAVKTLGPVEACWPRFGGEAQPRLPVLLVGMQGAYREPLSGLLGGRLAKLMRLSFIDYLDRVPRACLVYGANGQPAEQLAREEARRITRRCHKLGVPVVVTDRRAAHVMGLEGVPDFTWVRGDGLQVAVAPYVARGSAQRAAAEQFYNRLATSSQTQEVSK